MEDINANNALGLLMKFIIGEINNHSYVDLIELLNQKSRIIKFNHVENKFHWLGQQKIFIAIVKNQKNDELEKLYKKTYGIFNFSSSLQISFTSTILKNEYISKYIEKEINKYLFYLINNKNKINLEKLDILNIHVDNYNKSKNYKFISSS